jgi:hypothetical protein
MRCLRLALGNNIQYTYWHSNNIFIGAEIAQWVMWLGYQLDHQGIRVRFPAEERYFLFSRVSSPTLVFIRLLSSGTGCLFPDGQAAGAWSCEADRSSLSNTKIKVAWSYTSTSPYVLMAWYFIKHREKFISVLFYFLLTSWNKIMTCMKWKHWQHHYSHFRIQVDVIRMQFWLVILLKITVTELLIWRLKT